MQGSEDSDNQVPSILTVVLTLLLLLSAAHYVALQVRNLLHKRIRDTYMHPQFVSDVMKPLRMDELLDQVGNRLKNIVCERRQRSSVAVLVLFGDKRGKACWAAHSICSSLLCWCASQVCRLQQAYIQGGSCYHMSMQCAMLHPASAH